MFIPPSVLLQLKAPAGQNAGNEAGKWNHQQNIFITHLIKPIDINCNDAMYARQ